MSHKIINPMQANTTKELTDYVASIGYTEKSRRSGSHMIWEKSGKPSLSIPDHKNLAPGTRRNIAKLILGNSYYQKG